MNKEKLEHMLIHTNEEIARIDEQLQNFPIGHIECLNNGKYTKWFHVKNGSREYIPKSNILLAGLLSQKQYLLSLKRDLAVDQKALMNSLKCYKNYESKEKEFLENKKYGDILRRVHVTNISCNNPDDLETWCKEEYPKNTFNSGGLKYQSITGNMLRSKSEMIIDQQLFLQGIPYRYECQLKLGDSLVYPDFTIRHPKTGNFFYWEHFGMMDSPAYSQRAFTKLQNYCLNGYIPSINLITTFETSQYPLDVVKVTDIILHYFKK